MPATRATRLLRRAAMGAALAALLVGGLTSPASADPVVVAHAEDASSAVTITQEDGGTLQVSVTNRTAGEVAFGLGATMASASTVELLWRATNDADFAAQFRQVVGGGETVSQAVPLRTGVRYAVYRDADATTPVQVVSWQAPGRFAPLTVVGTGDSAQIRIGSPVTVTPSTVRAGEAPRVSVAGFGAISSAEVWLLPESAAETAFHFQDGSPLGFTHTGARLLGTVPVSGGTAAGTVPIPGDTPPGAYALLVGDSADDWWPGGPTLRADPDGTTRWSAFDVEAGAPRGSTPESTTPVQVTPLDQNGATPVTFSFPNVQTAGTTSVVTSTTGPTPSGFSALTAAPAYYALETTATFSGQVTVCISFATTGMTAEEAAGQSLFHYVDGQWVDITTSRSAGQVCGDTLSFSPFAIGRKVAASWPFTGFLAPVTNDAVNPALAGAVVPFRFRLGGDRGLNVLAGGSPTSGTIGTCRTTTAPAASAATASALPVKLVYVKATKTYWYLWKTDKAWAGTCRRFTMTLTDGSTHVATFRFLKAPGAIPPAPTPY